MNKLEVPEVTFFGELKIAFNAPKRSLSANWCLISVLRALLFALSMFLFTWFIERGIHDYFVAYSVLVALLFYVIDSTDVKVFRRTIIADMKAAKPFQETFGFCGYTEDFGTVHVTYVQTMAGELKFKSPESFPDIQKKAGQLFDYYVFNGVENLDMNDLRKFVAEPSSLIEK